MPSGSSRSSACRRTWGERDGVPGRRVGRDGLEVVAQAAVLSEGDEADRGARVHPAVGQFAAHDDRAWFGAGRVVGGGEGEPVPPGAGEGGGRVTGGPGRG